MAQTPDNSIKVFEIQKTLTGRVGIIRGTFNFGGPNPFLTKWDALNAAREFARSYCTDFGSPSRSDSVILTAVRFTNLPDPTFTQEYSP